MNHLKVKGLKKSFGAYIAGPYQFREIFINLRGKKLCSGRWNLSIPTDFQKTLEKNYAMENELGPIWIRSIFGVLDKYHGFMKYFGFRVSRSVWVQQTLWFWIPWYCWNCSLFGVLKLHSRPFFSKPRFCTSLKLQFLIILQHPKRVRCFRSEIGSKTTISYRKKSI